MVIVRRANPKDCQSIWYVRTMTIKEACKTRYAHIEIEAWSSVPMPEKFQDVTRMNDFLVAEKDGLIVACGFSNKEAAEIEAVFVRPD